MANRFIDEKDLQRIEVGDGDWIEIPAHLSYGFVSELAKLEGGQIEVATKILLKIVKGWNFTDKDGTIPDINRENLERLDYGTIMELMKVVEPMITPDPKVSVG